MDSTVTEFSRRSLLAGLSASLILPGSASCARAPERSLVPHPRPQAGLAGRASAAAPVAARPLDQLLARANLGGVTGFAAFDMASGEEIESHQPEAALPPASVAKAPTALYALHRLGSEHRFVTRLRSYGTLGTDGVLRGDLILEGGGDPTVQTADLAALAQQLVARGLRRVEGRFIIDETALPSIDAIDPGQVPQAGYSPAISGMNLNFNRVHFAWQVSGGQVTLGMDARSGAEVPPVSVIRVRTGTQAQPVYLYERRSGIEHWTVARGALGSSGSRWLPVRQPGLYAGDVFRALMSARGASLTAPETGRGRSGGNVLAEHRSQAMPVLMRDMLRFSTNITAESVGLAASLRAGQQVRDLAASGGQMAAWMAGRYGLSGLRFVDHSGLGDASRVTARQMARFFVAAGREGVLPDLLRQHVMRDAQGREMSSHPVSVRAKTGTLSFASGLGGYAQAPGGRRIAFAIFSADPARRSAIAAADRERPPGAAEWSRRARALQQALIERWAALHG